MEKIVTKFGGSSLAEAKQFIKVKDILELDARRCYVVPSAPGKRFAEDEKITDLLYRCFHLTQEGKDITDTFNTISLRYKEIADELSLNIPISNYLQEVKKDIENGANADYCASRGEYLNGLLLADYLGFSFVDPKDYIRFNEQGIFDMDLTQQLLSEALSTVSHAVIPGFYGSNPDGTIRTFSRGGSDISGAIVSRACSAVLYENWTDVNGFLMADPRIVPEAKTITNITYRELRELSYMGATVLHEDSIFPVHRAGITTNIRNTNCPTEDGTLITPSVSAKKSPFTITGIAGKRDFSVVSVEKAMMNNELGFGRRILQVVEELGLSFEHLPTGIDSLCVVLSTADLAPQREALIKRITEEVKPDSITIHDDMSIIATVGRGMVHNPGTAARLFSALSKEKVNVRMIDQGSSELSILVGVDKADFERAIHSIYNEFANVK